MQILDEVNMLAIRGSFPFTKYYHNIPNDKNVTRVNKTKTHQVLMRSFELVV